MNDILQAINRRMKYPILVKSNEQEIAYLNDISSSGGDKTVLVFPKVVLSSTQKQNIQLQEMIFKNWKIAGVFDIGKILEPEASIEFSMLLVQKTQPTKIRFGIFNGVVTGTRRRKQFTSGIFIKMPPLSEGFQKYTNSIQQILETDEAPLSGKDFIFYEVDEKEFNRSQLNARFYRPDLVENEANIRNEKWVRLNEIAQILTPRPINRPTKTLAVKDFEYPFPETIAKSENGTDLILKQGDILISSVDTSKSFLITTTPPDEIRASRNLYVIRPRSELVTPEYLFLYLKSETAQKYAARYEKGSVFRRITLETLVNFPVVIPSLLTKKQSTELFEKLFLLKSDDPIAEINKFLFTPQKLPQKAIQNEFITEVIESLRESKKERVGEILKSDFQEIERCLRVQAYKSCLILCGSILEVVLLDWLSEIDKKDYFESNDNIKLYAVIKKLSEQLGESTQKAQNVREKRNLVHPKELLKASSEINREVCRKVLSDLKDVLCQRGISKTA
ncbi:MAG: restriction endonuclease subunit S [Anaerolineales bacterium]|nr:restriction endonuclease subunit S [Anaerolineales bacterium]